MSYRRSSRLSSGLGALATGAYFGNGSAPEASFAGAPPVGAPELAGALEPDEAPAAGLPAGAACGAQAFSSSDAPAVPTSVPVAATLMKRRRLIWRRELSPSWFESGRLALSIAIE